ncbi:MAG: hypothetical protein FK731_10200 [Asgard group archaeon]|nr:hypothetical protein [Asgard group archaeon]
MKSILNKKTFKDKKGQIFLVCTIIIAIYMLSFISIIYELNVAQYSETNAVKEFENSFQNFRTETNNFVISLLANFSQPASIITSDAIAGQLLQDWLNFAELQMISKGYIAIFDIDEIIPITTPVELVNVNGRLGFRGTIDVYLECSYMSIDTQFNYNMNYTLSYVNTATNALIEFSLQTLTGIEYLGYATVTVNAGATTNYYNGTYLASAPLVGGDTIQATTTEQIIVTYVV